MTARIHGTEGAANKPRLRVIHGNSWRNTTPRTTLEMVETRRRLAWWEHVTPRTWAGVALGWVFVLLFLTLTIIL